MLTSIVLLVLAISGAITSYYANKRIDALQEQINDLQSRLEATLLHRATDYASLEELRQLTNNRINNLENQSKNNFNHFTSRIDKLRNDVLNNSREY